MNIKIGKRPSRTIFFKTRNGFSEISIRIRVVKIKLSRITKNMQTRLDLL